MKKIETILNWCGSHKTGTWNKKKLAKAKQDIANYYCPLLEQVYRKGFYNGWRQKGRNM